MTPEGMVILQQQEGLRLRVYDDATGEPIVSGSVVHGNPTIGIGRNLAGRGITDKEAQVLFADDIALCDMALSAYPWYQDCGDVRRDVLINMCFNLGLLGLLQFRGMIAALQKKDWTLAASEIRNSLAFRQLPDRYETLTKAMESGTWAAIS